MKPALEIPDVIFHRAKLKQAGTSIPANDMWVAALARQRTLPILSRDRHFDVIKGVQRVGW